MGEHYSKNTVWVTAYCRVCQRNTTHSCHDGRKGSCQECIKRLEAEAEAAKKVPPPATQDSLF